MKSCNLNIVVHSAKNLRDVKNFGIMSPFAEVWISGDGMDESKHKTRIARDHGCDPVWEYSIDFKNILLKKSNILFIDIKHHGKWTPDRNIGQVQVAFKDLLAGDAAAGDKVSYPVMIPSGNQTQGEIILSHRFTGLVSTPPGGKKVVTRSKTTTAAARKATTAAGGKAKTAASSGKATTAASQKATTAASGNATTAGRPGIATAAAMGVATIIASSVIGGVTESVVTGLMNDDDDYEEEEEEEEEDDYDDEEEEEEDDDEEEEEDDDDDDEYE